MCRAAAVLSGKRNDCVEVERGHSFTSLPPTQSTITLFVVVAVADRRVFWRASFDFINQRKPSWTS